MTQSDPSILAYAKPPPRKSNALSLTGLGIAILSLVIPVLMAFTLSRNRGQGVSMQIGVNPAYYALPLASIVLAILGARKSLKLLPSIVIILAVIAAGSTWFICSRAW